SIPPQLDHVPGGCCLTTGGVVRGASLCCPGGQVDDLLVGQVGGLDPPRDAVLGPQPAHAPCLRVDLGGRVPLVGPAVAEDRVRAGLGGAAERPPVAEQIPQAGGDDVRAGPLGGLDRNDPGSAASGDDVPVQRVELLLLG